MENVNIERNYLGGIAVSSLNEGVPLNFWTRIADTREMNQHRRQKKRNMCAELITISWTGDDGHSRSEMGTMEDISATCACIYLDHPIPAETELSLHYPQGKYQGKIKYCASQKIGYLLGIEFDNGSRWSRLDFQPAHLLELRLLRPKKINLAVHLSDVPK